jgi:hypothetical protein
MITINFFIALSLTISQVFSYYSISQDSQISMFESIKFVDKYVQESQLVEKGYYWTALQRGGSGDSVHYEAWFVKPDSNVGIYFGLGITTSGKIWQLKVPIALEQKPRMLPCPILSLQTAVSLASEYIYANALNEKNLYVETINLILPGGSVKQPYWFIELSKPEPPSRDPYTITITRGDDIDIAVQMDGTVRQMGTM